MSQDCWGPATPACRDPAGSCSSFAVHLIMTSRDVVIHLFTKRCLLINFVQKLVENAAFLESQTNQVIQYKKTDQSKFRSPNAIIIKTIHTIVNIWDGHSRSFFAPTRLQRAAKRKEQQRKVLKNSGTVNSAVASKGSENSPSVAKRKSPFIKARRAKWVERKAHALFGKKIYTNHFFLGDFGEFMYILFVYVYIRTYSILNI